MRTVISLKKDRLSNKSLRNSQLELTTSWQYTEEASPAFKRLVMLLLKPRNNQSVETLWPEEEHQNEQ